MNTLILLLIWWGVGTVSFIWSFIWSDMSENGKLTVLDLFMDMFVGCLWPIALIVAIVLTHKNKVIWRKGKNDK